MDKRAIFALLALLVTSSALAQAYRWVDEDGVVHYSDRPQEGAERIVLPKANTTTVRPYAGSQPANSSANDSSAAAATAGQQPEQPFRYESLEVSTPAAEETLWNIEGTLDVSLAVQPALQPGHQVRVYFDGEMRNVSGTSFTIDEVWRGVHNIQAEIVDDTGQLMIRSQTNRFYVQQNNVAF